jgi:transcriptional regulator with XRE-family HTH domain
MPARSTPSKRPRKTEPQSAAASPRVGRRKRGSSAPESRRDRSTEARPSIGLGPRLREARVAKELSARELARRISVSPSLISQIERDLAMPSVATLFAIANELGLVIDDLFRGDGAAPRRSAAPPASTRPGPVQRRDQRAVIRLNTGVRWERLTPAPDQDVEFLYVVYDVGGATAEDGLLFRHGGKEYGVVVSGRLGIQIGFECYELAPCDSVTFDARTPHRLWTIGNEPVTAIFAILGRHGDPRAGSAGPARRQAEPVDG